MSKGIEHDVGWDCQEEKKVEHNKQNEYGIDPFRLANGDELIVGVALKGWQDINYENSFWKVAIIFCIVVEFGSFRNLYNLIDNNCKSEYDKGVEHKEHEYVLIGTHQSRKSFSGSVVIKY